MEYQVHIAQGIEYIEANLKGDISLWECAAAAGYSKYHFLRVFKEATGLTPADYIRKRRITEIIKVMKPGTSLVQLAYEYGFNSKENFTRAFYREHHILPTEYRAALNSLKLYEPIAFQLPPFFVEPVFVQLAPFALMAYPSDEAYAPNFWNKYNGKNWSKKLSGGDVCEDYGVSRFDPVHSRIEYFIGLRKEKALGDAQGTVELFVEGGLYAVFTTPPTSHYQFVNTIHRTWRYINEEWLPGSGYTRAGNCDIETYVEDSRTYSEKIYIRVCKEEGK